MSEKQKKIPAGAREKLPFWFCPTWASSGATMAIATVFIGYATYYCTDVLQLSPSIIGIIMLLVRCTDGFTDLVIGYIVDNTHTKIGQARPYELAGALTWIFIMLFFSTPNLGTVGKYIWVFLMYFLTTAICQTIYYGSSNIYLMRAVSGADNRNKVVAFGGAIMMFITIVIGIVIPQMIKATGTSQPIWRKMIISFGIPMVLLACLRFLFIKELVDEKVVKSAEKIKIGECIRALIKNKYVLIFTVVYFMLNFTVGITNVVGTYFAKYYVGDIGVSSITNMAMLIMPLLLIVIPVVLRKFGSRKVLIFFSFCGLLSPLIRIICKTNVAGLFVSTIFIAIFQTVGVVAGSYMFECMEYGVWKTGIQVDGMIGSAASFAQKVAAGISSVFCGFVLSIGHYDGSLEVQPDSAVQAILVLENYIPVILAIIAIIFSFKYDLDKKLPQIREEMAVRNKKGI